VPFIITSEEHYDSVALAGQPEALFSVSQFAAPLIGSVARYCLTRSFFELQVHIMRGRSPNMKMKRNAWVGSAAALSGGFRIRR
jgi:hypothetical protein